MRGMGSTDEANIGMKGKGWKEGEINGERLYVEGWSGGWR